jgi:hypothetical protein
MHRRFRQLGSSLCLLLASGCTGLFGSRGLPPDPLFAHRKPVESQARASSPQEMPLHEPRPPANPYGLDHPSPQATQEPAGSSLRNGT